MNRRTVVAGAGSIGLASLAGCLGTVGLDEHGAAPAGVDQQTRDDTGYELTGVEEIPVEEAVDMVVYEETVSVVNHLTEHEKAVDMGPLGSQRGAVFMLLTTPQVSILGREFNPVGEMNTEELVDLVESNYDDVSDITHEEDDEVTVLEQETVQSTFSADAQFDGVDVDVTLHITEAVESGDDLLVAIGVYPDQVALEEEGNVRTLMDGIVDDLEETSDGRDDSDGDDSPDGDTDEGAEDGTADDDTDDGGEDDSTADDDQSDDTGVDDLLGV